MHDKQPAMAKKGWLEKMRTYMDLWGIIPTAYGDLNVGDEALH